MMMINYVKFHLYYNLPFVLWVKTTWIECFWIIKVLRHMTHQSCAQLQCKLKMIILILGNSNLAEKLAQLESYNIFLAFNELL